MYVYNLQYAHINAHINAQFTSFQKIYRVETDDALHHHHLVIPFQIM